MRVRRSLALLIPLAALGACSDDEPRIAIPEVTQSNVTPEEANRLELCDSLQTYLDSEERRSGTSDDATDLGSRFESRRLSSLDRLESYIADDRPDDVGEAIDALRQLPIETVDPEAEAPENPAEDEIATLTAYLDPICGTTNGRDTTTTLLLPPESTEAAPGATTTTAASSDTTAASSDTTAAASDTTAASN